MRILWFTNDPMPALNRHVGRPVASGTGHWMPSLLEYLVEAPGVEVEVVTAYPGLKDDEFTEGRVKYFSLRQPKRPGIFFEARAKDLAQCAALVRERAPDVVHIHGTERFYGLLAARKLMEAPCVISLQGLLSACREVFFGHLSLSEIWNANRPIEIASRRGLWWMYYDHLRAARYEREILSGAPRFMGRTEWDRAVLRSVNPDAHYHHVDELLRPALTGPGWDPRACEPHTILFTKLGRAPYRGTEVLLRAVPIIRRRFPQVRLRLAGSLGVRRGYDRFLRRAIAQAGLEGTVDLLGYLNADQLAAELCRTHVFPVVSYMENSPNSLCEAMHFGVPCVATYVGGIPSLLEHHRTGLLVPAGDPQLLAEAIMTLFQDEDLAVRLGRAARAEALHRHAPHRVLSQVLQVYREMVADRPDAPQRGVLSPGNSPVYAGGKAREGRIP